MLTLGKRPPQVKEAQGEPTAAGCQTQPVPADPGPNPTRTISCRNVSFASRAAMLENAEKPAGEAAVTDGSHYSMHSTGSLG